MILAAGLGTRLRPLTEHTPKALVPVGGVPMLERVARRLVAAGADRLVINASPHAERIRAFVEEKEGFGVEARLSIEPEGPLDTGGGLKHAEPHFRGDGAFLLHNVDVLTDADLGSLLDAHLRSGAVATLLVRPAATDRYLLFDDAGLVGYARAGEERRAREAAGDLRRVDFMGVHALSPRIFRLIEETGVFSIIGVYLRLARAGEAVLAHDVPEALWIDIGTHERLAEAERAVQRGEVSGGA